MDLVWPGAMETKLGFSWQNVMKHHETSWSIKGLSFSAQELPSKPSVSIYMHICQVSCTERRLRRYTCLPHHERRSTVKHATSEAAKKEETDENCRLLPNRSGLASHTCDVSTRGRECLHLPKPLGQKGRDSSRVLKPAVKNLCGKGNMKLWNSFGGTVPNLSGIQRKS